MYFPKRPGTMILVMGGGVFLFLIIASVIGSGRTITVDDDGGGDFLSIVDAVEHAADGDIIRIRPGEYRGNITVNSSIAILGHGADSVTIRGNGSTYGIQVFGDNVTIYGLTIIHTKRGISIESDDVVITGNRFTVNNTYGIDVLGSTNVVMADNVFENCKGSGIRVSTASDIRISGSDFSENGYGVNCINLSKMRIWRNDFSNHSRGIYLIYAKDVWITENSFTDSNREGILVIKDYTENIEIGDNVYSGNRRDVRLYTRADDDENPLGGMILGFSMVVVFLMVIGVIFVLSRKGSRD